MSKSTKIIAALGVVAGLGVAALPAFTFAIQTPQSVSGDAEVYVEVQPAIAMAITGNNDNRLSYTSDSWQYAIVADPTGDPSQSNYYERAANGTFALSADTTVNPDKTYFTRSADTTGVDVFSPMSAGNGIVDGHTEAFKVGPSSSYVSMLPNTVDSTKSVVSIWTNNASGYDLAVRANTSANMTMVEPVGGTDTIAAVSGTPATGTPGNYGWAFKVATPSGKTNVGDINADSSAATPYDYSEDSQMTTSDQHIVTSAEKTSGGDSWDVIYDIATKADQETGVYKVTLTYTATTNNS